MQMLCLIEVSGWSNDWAMNVRECLPSCCNKNTVEPVHVLVVTNCSHFGIQWSAREVVPMFKINNAVQWPFGEVLKYLCKYDTLHKDSGHHRRTATHT